MRIRIDRVSWANDNGISGLSDGKQQSSVKSSRKRICGTAPGDSCAGLFSCIAGAEIWPPSRTPHDHSHYDQDESPAPARPLRVDGAETRRNRHVGPRTRPCAPCGAPGGLGPPVRDVDPGRRGSRLRRPGAAGARHAGESHANHEAAQPGTGHSGGDSVSVGGDGWG